MPSFDIVSKIDMPSVQNGLDGVKKEISTRYDFKGSMCEVEHYPFEKPLHDIYNQELCISPIPSLAIHCTNVNSIFGLSPNVDWKKLWDENK